MSSLLSSAPQAALEGGLAVLDGVHRLPGGALAGAVGRLLTDREGALPDGTRLVPQAGSGLHTRGCECCRRWKHWDILTYWDKNSSCKASH